MEVIVISSVLQPEHIKLIEDTAAKTGARVCFAENENDVPDDFKDAEVVYGFGMNIAKTSKSLKWLCVPSAGVDYLMKPGTFANEECLLTNSSGAYGVTIAEHIIAVSLMMMRKLTVTYAEVLEGKWGKAKPQKSLKDCHITVLGTGDIGRNFARRARSFEPAALTGVCRSGICDEAAFDRVLRTEELDDILKETELLVMSLPDTHETRGILTGKRMEMMPEGSYIVNVGRGSAIDEDALAALLEKEHLAGAALDVFKTEPLPVDSPLWRTKNLLITPHVAGNLTLKHTLDRNVEMFCEDMINYSKGLPLKYLVDRSAGY
ncbi:MAG: D-2-hydroxyacid dehydrogenase [Lachnospiraceae bacterium]|nr:D-2-hydroxyacid dehydrogenase [Lachnospiraceae bacterium]